MRISEILPGNISIQRGSYHRNVLLTRVQVSELRKIIQSKQTGLRNYRRCLALFNLLAALLRSSGGFKGGITANEDGQDRADGAADQREHEGIVHTQALTLGMNDTFMFAQMAQPISENMKVSFIPRVSACCATQRWSSWALRPTCCTQPAATSVACAVARCVR